MKFGHLGRESPNVVDFFNYLPNGMILQVIAARLIRKPPTRLAGFIATHSHQKGDTCLPVDNDMGQFESKCI